VGADWLDETFEAVSNPDSPRYGKPHLLATCYFSTFCSERERSGRPCALCPEKQPQVQ
jgi:hypothetical protein